MKYNQYMWYVLDLPWKKTVEGMMKNIITGDQAQWLVPIILATGEAEI
jgi:hypothetical protein